MAVNLSIRNVPDEIAVRLRDRARRNHRSLQGELMAMIEAAATESAPTTGLSETSVGYRDKPDKPAKSSAPKRTVVGVRVKKGTERASKVPLRWPSEGARLVRDSRDIDGAFEDSPHGMQRMRRLTANEVLTRARARKVRTPGSVAEMVRQMRDER